jgi:tetratricopeptide (TPR) repeat protein
LSLRFLFSFILLSFFMPPAGRSEETLPTPAASPLALQNLTTTYRFQQDAVWAHLETIVRDHQDGFNITVKSDAVLTGWILRDASTNEVTQKGGLGGVKTFTVEILKTFKDGYRLTVFVKADQDQAPVVLNLIPREGKKESNGTTDAFLPDFEENADHPYNAMVGSLYKQASQAYSIGDKTSALNFLNQAAALDPTQAQVQTFRRMIQAGSLEKPSGTPTSGVKPSHGQDDGDHPDGESAEDLANGAKKAESNGDLIKARILYGKAVRLKPDQSDWTSALDQINRKLALQKFNTAIKDKNVTEAKSAFAKLKALDPDNSKLADWKKQLDVLQAPAPKSQADAQADDFYNQGLNSYRAEDWAGAKKYWEETLKIKPNHLMATQNLEKLIAVHPELK